MAHKVLTVVEHRDGELKKASREALTLGKELAAALGGTQAALVAGDSVSDMATAVVGYGAAAVYTAQSDNLATYSTDGFAAAVEKAAEQAAPDLVILAATAMGRDLAPRVAVRLGFHLAPDITEAHAEGGTLHFTRPQYAGKALWKLKAPAEKLVLTTRPNVFTAAAPEGGGSPETVAVDVSSVEVRARVTSFHGSETDVIDVAEADIIVAGGRGLKGPEHFPLLFDLAKVLGAGVGASRAVVDAGWIDHEHQVGQTGKTVSPNLYIALGISGAIQHLAGMRTSKNIVAINKDPDAPIFKLADYGIVGDVFEILPRFTEAAKAIKN